MKRRSQFTVMIFFILSKLAFSQLLFDEPKTITNSASGVHSIYVSDLDGDDIQDVIYITKSATLDDEIGWFKNEDTIFVDSGLLNDNIMEGRSVFACDIDGDNDNDVISGSHGKIAWYENTDGAGAFGTEQIIHNSGKAYSLYGCDLDHDNDIDIIAALSSDDEIVWFENTDGAGNFSSKNVINDTAYGASSVYASDIDSDGDMDVLASLSGHDQVEWYENTDSSGTFGPPNIISGNLTDVLVICSADIDGDDDQDVITGGASVTSGGDTLFWYENDGQGTFLSEHVISVDVDRVKSVFARDMDKDGDIDILSASSGDEKIAYYDNSDGAGTFTQYVINDNAFGANDVVGADINQDGQIDIVSASSGDSKIVWYQNSGDLQFIRNEKRDIPFQIYPVPVENELYLKYHLNDILSIEIFDVNGKCIKQYSRVPDQKAVDFSDCPRGIYLLQIQTKTSEYTLKVIKN